ncbi:hypothetical protein M406DRAFT_352900 [Cryphonectria parasitica EP155]|uniref:Uncharacterized protein n=1 Tax=Cryphonectria parasitica (strain ATCC 38755 / EP155) TaxID=660469 RepID=A0A9P4XWS8_CRYP1|nr:uncharacterized protein M406DRAFT_352900 [Cryphonectria parasitica EP155]KAF3762757.1 hypothetical protein M406DRAFT_352900 [Cryphonectria parasitica EP155]
MDSYLLKAAVLYALSAASRTCTAVDDILQSAYTATALFDSLTYELLDLKVPLERLGDPDLVIPRQLQPPILKIVRSCGDVLSHIDEWVEKTPRDAHQDAIPSTDNLQQLHSNLCTCRRALQLALEAVNLAGPEDDAIDANFFGTYLDHDTRRLLALIRRMLQQVQEGDREDPLKQALWSSLDEVRLYIQSKCRNQEDKKPSLIQALEAASCGGSQMSERDELSMASRMTPEPGPADSPPAAVATENRKGTNKLPLGPVAAELSLSSLVRENHGENSGGRFYFGGQQRSGYVRAILGGFLHITWFYIVVSLKLRFKRALEHFYSHVGPETYSAAAANIDFDGRRRRGGLAVTRNTNSYQHPVSSC